MSLLTPLYVAGVLAVALPVLFHLLRRAPQHKQTFSSLMFLSPTPPRFTRRSRVSNWLLLLLRAAVLTLLALAFARPLFDSDVAVASGGPAGRRISILVDTSASMRRGDLWPQAKARAGDVLASASPRDEVSLTFFDRGVRPAVSFEQWNRLDAAQRTAAVRAQLDAASPTWEATAIGDAVADAAEQSAAADAPGRPAVASRTVVLISDLQQGGRPEALANRAWPEAVRLDVRPVTPASSDNAGLQVVAASAETPDADGRLRVRVANGVGSAAEQFTLAWADANGPLATAKPQAVYAAAGRGQVVRVDAPPAGAAADRLVLGGDAQPFDNTLFVARPRQAVARVVYHGPDAFDDTRGLAFYLRTALGDTPQRRVDLVRPEADRLTDADLADAGLLVVGRPLADDTAAAVRRFVDHGGDVLWVLRQAADAGGLAAVAGVAAVDATESDAGRFALLARLDTTHPLLAVFADPRFGDFGRIHFWHHRTLRPPPEGGLRPLASFDDGDPFLLEKPIGRGRLFVMTGGWQPADSQLALSPKFVPILDGLPRPREGGLIDTQLFVGDALRVPAAATAPWTLTTPDGTATGLPAGSATPLTTPGICGVRTPAGDVTVAVNLRPDESRTAAISPADFTQWGAKLAGDEPSAAAADDERHVARRAELENRQKLWQWLIVGALGFVAAETLLAGLLTRRPAAATAVPAEG